MKLKVLFVQAALSLSILANALGQDIEMDGNTILNVSFSNTADKVAISVMIPQLFPARDITHVSDTISANNQQIALRCPVRTTQVANVSIQNRMISLLMVPGDTLNIVLSGSSSAPEIEISGKTSKIQQYYRARDKHFPVPVSQLLMTAGVEALNLHEFKVLADSLYSLDVQLWKTYQQRNDLPSWFIRYESDAIRYRNAWLRYYMITYQKFAQNKSGELPPNYFDFLKALPVRNEAAMYDDYYMRFLYDYVRYNAKVGTTDFNQVVEFGLAKEMLGDKIGDWYMLFSISSYLQGDPGKVKSDLGRYAFPSSFEYLVKYLLDRVDASSRILSPGDEAPDFFLEDQLDSLIALSDFKNHIVYLSFWFPGCKGCIREFPFENALVEKFEGKPVKIINICTYTTKSKWASLINKYKLKTLNLYANKSWQKRLEAKYGIGVYPHYVLIDRQGRVIENYATRPSKDVSKKIEDALNEDGAGNDAAKTPITSPVSGRSN